LIEDIIHDRRKDPMTIPLRFALGVFEQCFLAGTTVRNFLYDRHVLKAVNVPCRVVSVGNLTVGGTGKTPVVIMLAGMLAGKDVSVAVVSRGYGGTAKTTTVVSDGKGVLVPAAVAGDEPCIIADSLPGVPVVVGHDRYSAAQTVWEKFRPKIILLDDGFQHRRLHRNVDIVTVDAANPFGSGRFLPRGILRETPYSLKRAQAVIVTRYDEKYRKKAERMIRYYDRRIPIFWSRHVPVAIRALNTGKRHDTGILDGRTVATLSNIANPASFHTMIESLGARIVFKRISPDHHVYSESEMETIVSEASRVGADAIVMTAKDERNLSGSYRVESIEIYVLDIEAEIVEGEDKLIELIKPYR